MALPTRPLAILDACGTTRSIAREVDGNVTPNKTLETLGDTAFGAGQHAMSDFEGYANAKSVCFCTYSRVGSCGQAGIVSNCSCLVVNPAMTTGDRFDMNFCFCIDNQEVAGGNVCVQVIFRCNCTIMSQCTRTFSGIYQGTYLMQDIDPGDAVTSYVVACASPLGQAGDTGLACSCLVSISDQQGSSFAIGTPNSNFVVSVKNF